MAMKAVKARLIPYGTIDVGIEFQFFPETISDSKSVNWGEREISARSRHPSLKFRGFETRVSKLVNRQNRGEISNGDTS